MPLPPIYFPNNTKLAPSKDRTDFNIITEMDSSKIANSDMKNDEWELNKRENNDKFEEKNCLVNKKTVILNVNSRPKRQTKPSIRLDL